MGRIKALQHCRRAGIKAIELRNWSIHRGWSLEELRVVVSKLDVWMANPLPPHTPLVRLSRTNGLPPGSDG